MQVKYPYKGWITIFLNGWVIILLVTSLILIITTLLLVGIICLILTFFAVKGALNKNKRYNQVILALRISETASESSHFSDDLHKKHYLWKINDLYMCINYKEYWNETTHEKYWPKRIPYGLFCIYELAQYWDDNDIEKTALNDIEIKFANSTKKDAKDFILAIKNAEEVHEKRLEKHIENMARITGKDYWEVHESVMDKEYKRIEEFEEEKEKRELKKTEEKDRILDNSAKMIFTGVTGKCPFCLKKISMFAVKCPHCTADLRK